LGNSREDRFAGDACVWALSPAHRRGGDHAKRSFAGFAADLRASTRKTGGCSYFCALLGVVFNQWLFATGLKLTTVVNTVLISTTIPVFTLLIGA